MSELFERKSTTFGYYINLDERGHFDADLRDMDDKSLMSVTNEEQDEDGNVSYGEIGLVDAGYMKHGRDLSGLAEYAIQMGVIPEGSTVLDQRDFEEAQQKLHDDWQQAVDVLDQYDCNATVAELYDDNEELSSALNDLIHGFEYPDFSQQTIGQIKQAVVGQGAAQDAKQSKAMRMG